MDKRYSDCISPNGICAACSLSNYNRDCHNNPINVVAYHRHRLGLSQQQLAALCGMHYKQIQKLEWGQSSPANITLRNGLALAKALGISPEDLISSRTNYVRSR